MMKSKYPTTNKSEFVERLVSRQKKLGAEVIQDASKKIFEQLSAALNRGQRIEIRGFGSFCLRHRKERIARNPQTGQRFHLQCRSVPYFKPGKGLRDKVDKMQQGDAPIISLPEPDSLPDSDSLSYPRYSDIE